jgi:hypothetical protein
MNELKAGNSVSLKIDVGYPASGNLFHSVLRSEVYMKFNTVETAYSALADYLQAFVGDRRWDAATVDMKVFETMAKGAQSFEYQGLIDATGGFEGASDAIWTGLDAAIFLRDDLLKTTGQRIWGLSFTLYPTGKFNIEYDYDKPEGHEVTDETIMGDEINASIDQLMGRGSANS